MDDARRTVIYLGMPRYGEMAAGAARAIYRYPTRRPYTLLVTESMSSLLANGFNLLWAGALNAMAEQGATHFAMLHADVEPEPYWLDVLMDELERTGVDILSAVVPIKDERGITSTGIGRNGDRFDPLFRLTMRDVHQLPETFTAADCDHPENPLLINTGCWVCKLGEWSHWHAFTIDDKIELDPRTGKYVAKVEPEDWRFSRWAHARGLKVAATRKVRLNHRGMMAFTNAAVWGSWMYDQDHLGRNDHGDELAAADRQLAGEGQVGAGHVPGGADRRDQHDGGVLQAGEPGGVLPGGAEAAG